MNTILVIGATGQQGGAVAKHLLDRRQFAVRALTRNPESEAAQRLRRRGAEVVQGDLDDRASLRAAMKGAYGVFGVTNDWEQGRNLINAVAGAEIEHFVFSSRSLDAKDELEQYARSLDIPSTFINADFAVDDMGAVVAAIFEQPESTIGETIRVIGDATPVPA